jgi:hypothetical protein
MSVTAIFRKLLSPRVAQADRIAAQKKPGNASELRVNVDDNAVYSHSGDSRLESRPGTVYPEGESS